jgi:hypothetical protein
VSFFLSLPHAASDRATTTPTVMVFSSDLRNVASNWLPQPFVDLGQVLRLTCPRARPRVQSSDAPRRCVEPQQRRDVNVSTTSLSRGCERVHPGVSAVAPDQVNDLGQVVVNSL